MDAFYFMLKNKFFNSISGFDSTAPISGGKQLIISCSTIVNKFFQSTNYPKFKLINPDAIIQQFSISFHFKSFRFQFLRNQIKRKSK
jgi:hypothetical protein